jgi:hypothetical protein
MRSNTQQSCDIFPTNGRFLFTFFPLQHSHHLNILPSRHIYRHSELIQSSHLRLDRQKFRCLFFRPQILDIILPDFEVFQPKYRHAVFVFFMHATWFNILNNQSRTVDKGRSSRLGIYRCSNNLSPQKESSLQRNVTHGLGLGGLLWKQ